jgi:hypothetical protein
MNYVYNNQLDAPFIFSLLINTPVHVSGLSMELHPLPLTVNLEVRNICLTHILPPNDGLLIRPKHVDAC